MRKKITDSQIKKLRRALLNEKKRILKSLQDQRVEEERVGESWHDPKDLEDWAAISLSEELKSRLADRDLSLLREIDRALERIGRKEYGVCVKCGEPIEFERLEILPWTQYCSECAKKVSL
jgi:RNA polymerase-binding protein DksA